MHDSSNAGDSLSSVLSRRKLVAGGAVSLAAVAAAGRFAQPAHAARLDGSVSFGSNASDATPKAAYQKVFDAFTAKTGTAVEVNTVDHNTFQEQINNYLQGKPDDVFTWFAGYRMQFFAQKGLAGDISDVWKKIGSSMSSALKGASTGADGKQYFVPFYFYPWAVFYRKSVFKKFGYTAPKTLDQFIALSKRMQKDGLTPMAFADKDGWPAMGTFDYINMRTNGYDFHVRLMAGKEAWTVRRSRPSSTRGAASSRTTRTELSAGPGRRQRSRSVRRKPACTCSDRSSASSSRVRPTTTSTSSRSPRSIRSGVVTRSRRRSTAS
jgi:multiple sugar transport system substrate-binding protein